LKVSGPKVIVLEYPSRPRSRGSGALENRKLPLRLYEAAGIVSLAAYDLRQMKRHNRPVRFAFAALFVCAVLLGAYAVARSAERFHWPAQQSSNGSTHPLSGTAVTPPMGWNSWDSYGETVTDSDIRANARVMAKRLKQFGWQYVVVDMGWYVENHSAEDNGGKVEFSLDHFGRYTPALNAFPSAKNAQGFKPLADYVHSLGLKFGIHILQGIPRIAVRENLPIADSPYHAGDAADTSDTCPWNSFNYGARPGPAAQAYYDSILKLYASWGVDFLKVDCVASQPYKGADIRMFAGAIRKIGRPVVLSLSPGPAPLDKGDDLTTYANMWRISDDVWDLWHSDKIFPQGPGNQFARAEWAKYSGPGHWPDADMLPLGQLKPAPGWGSPRPTRLTHDEQRTLITLWSIFRSPLIMGGNLAMLDDWTASLLTNREVIAVDQHSRDNHAAINTSDVAVWVARQETGNGYYIALFNLKNNSQRLTYSWRQLALLAPRYNVRDLWEHKDLGPAKALSVNLAPHASALYRVNL
jgi:alpha-galactosidase